MERSYKLCPRCGCEYLATVEVCADCGLALVWEGEARDPQGEDLVLPSQEGLVRVREAELGWAMGLGKALARAGIPHRLDPVAPGGTSGRWVVSVGEADATRAQEVDADYARGELPALEAAPAPPGAAGSEDACPACGEPVTEAVTECPGCGLVFAPVG
jgi:hypothetical protein